MGHLANLYIQQTCFVLGCHEVGIEYENDNFKWDTLFYVFCLFYENDNFKWDLQINNKRVLFLVVTK